jgi:uncharacterized protein (DUF2267 family)
MVILGPDASAREAARAMESNRVGIVIVQSRGHVLGVVTDRDLALRVTGLGLDPDRALLDEIMTDEPATLPVSADEQRALELMRTRHVRRIPVLEGERVVGIVTLDDLVLSGDSDPNAIAAVIHDQLAQPADMKPAGITHPARRQKPPGSRSAGEARHAAHAIQTSHRAARLVADVTGLYDFDQAMTALEIVAGGLAARIVPQEARDLLAQLPSEVRDRVLESLVPGPDTGVTRETIEFELVRRLPIDAARASELVVQVGLALEHLVSPGEINQVRAQLSSDLRAILPEAIAHPTP